MFFQADDSSKKLFVLCCTAIQIIGEDFAKFCGLLRIYELYYVHNYLQTYLILRLFLDSQSGNSATQKTLAKEICETY